MFEEWCGEDDRWTAFHAAFSIRWDILAPAAVRAAPGIAPTRAFAKGEAHQTAAGLLNGSWGIWRLSTEDVVASRSPEQQARHLLELLEPPAEVVRRYVYAPVYSVRVLL
jgi:hypothetical protein